MQASFFCLPNLYTRRMNASRKHYTSDLTDAQWALVQPLIPPPRPGGDNRTTDMRAVVDAVLYLNKNGCAWRDLPGDFPHWNTVYSYFAQWRDDGTWQRIYETLHRRWRRHKGRAETPSAASIDSQSVKASDTAEEQRGFDGGKLIKGRKRHLMVDTEGFPVAVRVTAASTDDRHGAMQLLQRVQAHLPRLKLIWADAGYSGAPFETFVQERGWRLEVVHKDEAQGGFQVLARRWVVERTFAWLMKCRRLCRDFERLVRSVESLIYLAMTRLLVRRLAPKTSTPTS